MIKPYNCVQAKDDDFNETPRTNGRGKKNYGIIFRNKRQISIFGGMVEKRMTLIRF
jgi:hypothetical protein